MSVLTNDKLKPVIEKYGLTPSREEINSEPFQTALKVAYGVSAQPPSYIFDIEYTLAFIQSVITNETDPEARPDGIILGNKLAPRAEPGFANYFASKINHPDVVRAHTGPYKDPNQSEAIKQLQAMHREIYKKCVANRKAGKSYAVKNEEFYNLLEVYKSQYPLVWKSMYIISSFGAFQTLGWSIHDFVFRDKSSYKTQRPFERVYDYYIEIEQNPELQFERFVQFCIAKSGENYKTDPIKNGKLNLYWAIRMGHITSFAYYFNGPAYKTNRYDTKLTTNIKKYYEQNLAEAEREKEQEPGGVLGGVMSLIRSVSSVNEEDIEETTEFKNEEGPYLPLGPYRVTSPYGQRTVNGKVQNHTGLDIVPLYPTANTPVRAVYDGEVAYVFNNWKNLSSTEKSKATGGNYVILNHEIDGKKFTTSYLHLDTVLAHVKKGVTVRGNEPIGIMGNTGASSGAHLHLSIHEYVNNIRKTVDPLTHLRNAKWVDYNNRVALNHSNPYSSKTPESADITEFVSRTAKTLKKIKEELFGTELPDIVGISGDIKKRTVMTNDSFDYLKRNL